MTKILLYKFLGYKHNPYGLIGSSMKKRASEILSDGKTHAYIETINKEFLDLNICTTNTGYWKTNINPNYENFYKTVFSYILKKYKVDLYKIPFGFSKKEDIVLEEIYKIIYKKGKT